MYSKNPPHHHTNVVCCGLEIIKGKFIVEGNVSERDWQHYVVALLFHDIGFSKRTILMANG